MLDLNQCNIIGRFGQKPELKALADGKNLCNFDLAVKVTKDVTEWIPCTAWGDTAEFIVRFFDKGARIAIEGNVRVHTYEKDGVKNKSQYIEVKQAHFIDSKADKPAAAAPEEPKTEMKPPMIDLNEEDLPF